MATIDVLLDFDRDITVFNITGDLTADEIITAIQLEYAHNPTTHVIWDLSAGSLDRITADDFRRVARAAQGTRVPAPEAKTAWVGSDDLAYGLMRMYTALAEAAEVPANYQVFRQRADGFEWILGSRWRGPP